MARISFGLSMLLAFLFQVWAQSGLKQDECHALDGTPCLQPTESEVLKYFQYYGWNSTCFKYKGKRRCMIQTGRLRLCSCSKECDCGGIENDLTKKSVFRKPFNMKKYGRKRRINLKSRSAQVPSDIGNTNIKVFEQWQIKIERNEKGKTSCYISNPSEDNPNNGLQSSESKETNLDDDLKRSEDLEERSLLSETSPENPINDLNEIENVGANKKTRLVSPEALMRNPWLQNKCKCTCEADHFMNARPLERNNQRLSNLEEDTNEHIDDYNSQLLYPNIHQQSLDEKKVDVNCNDNEKTNEILSRYEEIKRILKQNTPEPTEKTNDDETSDRGMFSFVGTLNKTVNTKLQHHHHNFQT